MQHSLTGRPRLGSLLAATKRCSPTGGILPRFTAGTPYPEPEDAGTVPRRGPISDYRRDECFGPGGPRSSCGIPIGRRDAHREPPDGDPSDRDPSDREPWVGKLRIGNLQIGDLRIGNVRIGNLRIRTPGSGRPNGDVRIGTPGHGCISGCLAVANVATWTVGFLYHPWSQGTPGGWLTASGHHAHAAPPPRLDPSPRTVSNRVERTG